MGVRVQTSRILACKRFRSWKVSGFCPGPAAGRRVIQGRHPHAVFLKKLPVFLGDLKIRPDDLRRADASQAHQDLRLHQLQLPPQKSGAGVLFGVQRVPVFGRAALDAVGDVDFLPPQADHGQHIVQQLPGGSHKGLALLVLAGPGGLAHQQHLRRGGPHPEHHVGPGIRQAAGPAAHALLPQLLPLVHIFPPFPRLRPGIAAALPGQNEGEGSVAVYWLWLFCLYSFLGYLLEKSSPPSPGPSIRCASAFSCCPCARCTVWPCWRCCTCPPT